MCSGQSRTRCFALIIFVVIELPVAADFVLEFDPALSARPLGAGESARPDLPRPPPLDLGAGLAFGSAFDFAFDFEFGSVVAGTAFGVGIVPSFNGGGVNLSIAVLGKLSLCL